MMTYHGKKHYEKEQLENLVATSSSKHEIIAKLGLPTKGTYGYRTLNYFLDLYGIEVKHYSGRSAGIAKRTIPLQEILDGAHPRYPTGKLRVRLIKDGIFQHQCAGCDNTEWKGEPIPLELDHMNGKPWDHQRDNIQLLCPNCHAQTTNYRGKNVQKNVVETSPAKTRKQQEIAVRRDFITTCGVDFSSRGWITKTAALVGIRPQKLSAWMRAHMIDFYEGCFHI